MIAYSFHHGYGSRVTHGKTFTDLTVDIDISGSGSIEQGIACYDILLGTESCLPRRTYRNRTSTQALAQVIVGFAFQTEMDFRYEKGSETLAGRPVKGDVKTCFPSPACP